MSTILKMDEDRINPSYAPTKQLQDMREALMNQHSLYRGCLDQLTNQLNQLNQPMMIQRAYKPDAALAPIHGPFAPAVWGKGVLEQALERAGAISSLPANHGKPKRAGRFELPASDVLNMEWGVMGIMTRCCIVRAEHNLVTDRVEYTALSPMFDELADGQLVPTYQWEVEGTNLRAVKVPVK